MLILSIMEKGGTEKSGGGMSEKMRQGNLTSQAGPVQCGG